MAHLDIGYVFGNSEAACLGEARQQNVQEGGHLGGHVDRHLRQREGKRRHLLDLALALAQELQAGEMEICSEMFCCTLNEDALLRFICAELCASKNANNGISGTWLSHRLGTAELENTIFKML
jgi:hypothetical protein